ncbi:hypothetical protein COY27_05595 [Candidatus Woesearchaeota archaeon CG_4_10_14_0_2_um_filter_33_13]|nr:MAG: hypothetical protein COY27_05595 [Candidatus Woesearchaeota archaeon CG_4_10_14_0_2_um_filter_33_13]
MLAILVFIVLFVSVFLIWKGSDWITDSMIPVANKLGTSYVAVTSLLVSFLISIPEVFTSVYSYLQGHLNVGIGVIIGSVMINIGLTIGISATIKPLKIEKSIAIRDGIYLVIIAAVVLLMGADLNYNRNEGLILILLFMPYLLNVWFFEKHKSKKSKKEKVEDIKKALYLFSHMKFLKLKPSVTTFVLGASLLISGSYLLSYCLIQIKEICSLPGLLVGLIIGAVATATPNIITAVQGTLRGFKDVAITETFGANIFTLLITLGILILMKPFAITGRVFYFDLTWMIMIHLLVVMFIFKGYHYHEESLTRYEGIALILFYLAIVAVNYLMR